MAEQLVGNLAEEFHPEKYTDDYRENLMKIIRAKMKGKTVTFEEPAEPEATPVLDLVSRLQASLEQAEKKSRPRKAAATHREGATTRKKTTRARKQKSA